MLPECIPKLQADCFHSQMQNVAGLAVQAHAWLAALIATCPIFSLSKCEEKNEILITMANHSDRQSNVRLREKLALIMKQMELH